MLLKNKLPFWIALNSYVEMIVGGVPPLSLTKAKNKPVKELKAFGGTESVAETYIDEVTADGKCEQRNLPSGYTELEYIESTGTQYIDTGIKQGTATTYATEIVYEFIDSIVRGISLCGSRQTGYSSWGQIYVDSSSNRTAVWASNPNSAVSDFVTAAVNTVYTDKFEVDVTNGSFTRTINGSTQTTTGWTFTPAFPENVFLFGYNSGNNTPGQLASVAMYSAKFWKDGVLVRNFIPCKNASNVVGMYDTVSGTFFENAGTGDFVAGNAVSPTPTTPLDIVCNNGVLKVSPNLANFVSGNIVLGYAIDNSTGQQQSTPSSINFYCQQYIPVQGGKSYVFCGRNTNNTLTKWNRIHWYDSSKTFISTCSYTVNTVTIATAPANAAYARISCNPLDNGVTLTQEIVDSFNWVFQKGTAEPPYMPYGQIYTDGTTETITDALSNTATCERLLSVGDYKDTQAVVAGTVTHNVGVKVLDGTEYWYIDGGCFRYNITDKLQGKYFMYCTHFQYTENTTAATTNGQFGTPNSSNSVYFKATDYVDVTAWTNWLAAQYANGTPVVVLYPLATATTETVTGQFLSKSPVTYSGSLTGLTGTVTETSHTVPTPKQPLDINTNNGVLKARHQSGLPLGYQRVEYITNTAGGGTSYVSVGGLCRDNKTTGTCEYETTMELADITTRQIFGYGGSQTNHYFGVQAKHPEIGGTSTGINTQVTLSVNTKYTFKVKFGRNSTTKTELWVYDANGDLLPNGHNTNDAYLGTETSNYFIFKSNYTGIASAVGCKFYGAKIWFDNTQVGNLIPCVRSSNNAVGVYNTVDGTFWAKTGSVSAGNTVSDPVEIYTDGPIETIAIKDDQNATVSTATCEDLLSVGTYTDEQEVISGGVMRKVGIKVLDGTEDWVKSGNLFYVDIANDALQDTHSCYCTHFQGIATNASANYQNEIKVGTNSTANIKWERVQIYPVVNTFSNAAALKTWLADQYATGMPVVIVYPLETTTTETVTGQPMSTVEGDNIVEITQASMDGLELEVKYIKGA